MINHFLTCETGNEYKPGEAGGEWTEEEIRVTRLRILEMLDKEKGKGTQQPSSEVTMLRLAFHDCLTYTDGTGGCDGKDPN